MFWVRYTFGGMIILNYFHSPKCNVGAWVTKRSILCGGRRKGLKLTHFIFEISCYRWYPEVRSIVKNNYLFWITNWLYRRHIVCPICEDPDDILLALPRKYMECLELYRLKLIRRQRYSHSNMFIKYLFIRCYISFYCFILRFKM